MIWSVFCYIFGVIAIIGPICCIFWYASAAKKRIADMGKK